MSAERGHWFEPLADHAGATYLRYSFTKGTEQEVEFLIDALGLNAGARVLDVGCGPGRHTHALADRGMRVVGLDIAQRFVEIADAAAPPSATFVRGDARMIPFESQFDAVISLCQGGFGLPDTTDPVDVDAAILEQMGQALRPGGKMAVSAFSAYFQLFAMGENPGYREACAFDAPRGVNHERTMVKDDDGIDAEFDLWTRCFTPLELRLLADRARLVDIDVWSVAPGRYEAIQPSIDTPEFLLTARRP